ncbi:hypothetical protein [Merismopedia glauca]|nr:hypothetical protein [Merismopedia glauca]
MWNCIDQDLKTLQQEHTEIDIKDTLRYREFREGLLREFVGDMFMYLHQKRGFQIRKKIAEQLTEFIQEHPQENELHIISHSLGSVIFWDILFSDRFEPNDPAFEIRSLLQNLDNTSQTKQFYLKSITTMGSPILFFNTMLGIDPNRVKEFAARNQNSCLKWLNIIHSSDIIAYPLKSSFSIDSSDKIELKDVYITDSNAIAIAARFIGQKEVAMFSDAGKAHAEYWSHTKTPDLIIDNIQGVEKSEILGHQYLKTSIEYLQKVPGMTIDQMKLSMNSKQIATLNFPDRSGYISYVVNFAGIHCVYVFNEINICQFAGYVGWLDNKNLKQAIELIETIWCLTPTPAQNSSSGLIA